MTVGSMAMPTIVNNVCGDWAVIDNGTDIIVQRIPGPVKRGLLCLDRRKLLAADAQVSTAEPLSTVVGHYPGTREMEGKPGRKCDAMGIGIDLTACTMSPRQPNAGMRFLDDRRQRFGSWRAQPGSSTTPRAASHRWRRSRPSIRSGCVVSIGLPGRLDAR
jgi:hypothetical protein